MTESKRVTQPLCKRCSHPRSFHGGGGPCRALGCVKCKSYVKPAAPKKTPAKK